MNKSTIVGLVVGAVFALAITWVAASDALVAGGLVLLASAVFGLAAGLCIGGLIAANFALLEVEKTHAKDPNRKAETELPAAA